MLNCSAVLAKNGSLYNNTFNLAAKDSRLQRCVALNLKKTLFQTSSLGVEKNLNVRELERHSLNRFSTVSCSETFSNITTRQNIIRDQSIRGFHTCFTMKYTFDANDTSISGSSMKHESTSKMNIKDLFDNNNNNNEMTANSSVDDTSKQLSTSQNSKSSGHTFDSKKLNIKAIAKKYPDPKGVVNSIYQIVKSDKNISTPIITHSRKKGSKTWQCTMKVSWPEDAVFTSTSNNKVESSNAVALKCLQWLEMNNKLKNGKPIIYSNLDIKELSNRPERISLKTETLNAAKKILDKYEENIQSIIDSQETPSIIKRHRFEDGAIIDPVGKSNPANFNPNKINQRNELLQHRYQHRMSQKSYIDLPILEFRQKILDEIEKNSVVVIKGDTGCGKTTQVPQYIMDSFAECGRATDCNMIVAQPRRISAVSLAEQIAEERLEQVGDVVGYQVRLEQKLPTTPAGILFCTTGILLRKLQFNPTLKGCTHVIIDEAHERSINVDMLLVLLKRTLQQRPTLKIIIMSATINPELFQNYFNCNVIDVPGRMYPVEMHFLDDIDKFQLQSTSRWDSSFESLDKDSTEPTVDITKMGELISLLTRTKPPGAILCFLPGWSEISKMRTYLEDYSFLPKDQILILPVHSKTPYHEQRKIFAKPPPNVRKIVLATDIAETGITIKDVVYVVDSCIQKQVTWIQKHGLLSMDNHWASRANINQRKGRAGRVGPGTSYHFITRDKYKALPEYPTPEIMRSILEKTVLDAKTYSDETALDFFGSMPDPPSHATISQALQNLMKLGALDKDENLTPLGKRISLFTLNPQLSKAIVYSSIFQCVSPLITIASLLSEETHIFVGVLENKANINNAKRKFHPTSDHISISWLVYQWYSLNQQNRMQSREFAYSHQLNESKLYTLNKIREMNAEHLYHAQMLPNSQVLNDMSAKENNYVELDELCRGVLLAGVDQVLYQRDFDIKKNRLRKGIFSFIMENGHRATITPDSVNFKRKFWPSPYLTYVRRTHSTERRVSLIRETSIISPLTVFLFSQEQIFGHIKETTPNAQNDICNDNIQPEILFSMKNRNNIYLISNKETADVLFKFRDTMWKIVQYLVAHTGTTETRTKQDLLQVEEFKVELLHVLGKMLSEASTSIDNPNPKNSQYQNNVSDEMI